MVKINRKMLLVLAILSIFMLIPSSFAGEIDDSNQLLADSYQAGDFNQLSDYGMADSNSADNGIANPSSTYNEIANPISADDDYNLSYTKVKDNIIADSNSIYVSNDGDDDSGDGSDSNPYKTISKAIETYNPSVNSDIFIKNGEYSITSQITINKDLTIIGESREGAVLKGKNANGIFKVNSDYVQLNSLSFIGEYEDSGSLIDGSDYINLTINNCIFKNATGGAISSNAGFLEWYPAKLIVNNTRFVDNSKSGSGGAISLGSIYSSLNVSNSQFINNSATSGGAISLSNNRKESEINNCRFISNNADVGSAIRVYNGDNITVVSSQFTNNTAGEGSAVIDFDGGWGLRHINLGRNLFRDNVPELDIKADDSVQIVYLDLNDKISAENIDMKNGDDVNFTVTLTDKNGNGLSGKTITLNLTDYFSKVTTYTAITNDNGIATISLINQSAGTYTAYSYFGGDENYDAVDTINTVKIKADHSYNIYFSENPLKISAGDSYNVTGITCNEYMTPVVFFTTFTVTWISKSGSERTTTGGQIRNSRLTVDVNDFDLEINDQYYYINFIASDEQGTSGYGTLIIDTSVPLPPVDRDIDIIYVSPDGSDETGDGTIDNPLKTLPVALYVNEEFGGNKTVFLKEGRYGVSNLEIYKDVNITGVKSKSIVYQRAADNGMLYLDNNATIRFTNITFTEGLVSEYTLYACVIVVRYTGSVAYFDGCEFVNNTASSDGMMYIAHNAEAYFNDCLFADNYARTFNAAGAVHVQGAYMFMNNTVFRNNTASEGGALFIGGDSRVEVYNTIFENNTALNDTYAISGGGAVYINNWDNHFYNCSFIDNYAEVNGGGIYILTGNVDIDRCYFENNRVASGNGNSKGGAIASDSGYTVLLYVKNSILLTNNSFRLVQIVNDMAEENEVILNNNYWGSNSAQNYDDWVKIAAVIDPCEIDEETHNITVNKGELTEITVKFVNKDGNDMEESVHDYLLYINASLGTVDKDSIVIVDNIAKFNYYPTAIGNETITLSNNGTRYKINFTVSGSSKEDMDASISINDDKNELTIQAPADLENNVTIIIDEESHSIEISESTTKIPIELLPGSHTIKLSYEGDSKYNAFISEPLNVEVDKYETNLKITAMNTVIGETVVINITANSKLNDNVVVNIDNKNHTVPLTNGTGSLELSTLAVGTYEIKAIFNGNDYFLSDEDTTTLIITDSSITELYVNGATGSDETGDGSSENPYATIAQALNRNKNLGGGKIIHVSEGNYTLNRYSITSNVTVIGEGDVTISSENTNHINIAGNIKVQLEGLTFINGKGIIAGSIDMGSDNEGNLGKVLNIYNCNFINNTGLVGAISSYANTKIRSSTFINNTATGKTGYNQAIISIQDNPGEIEYNIFYSNKYENSIIVSAVNSSGNLNFWGENKRPSEFIENLNMTKLAVIVPSISDDIRTKTDYDLALEFMETEDGISFKPLDDIMPKFSFDLSAELGQLNPSAANLENNYGTVNYNVNTKGTELICVLLDGVEIANLTFTIDVPEYDKIYVSKTGNDANSGSVDSPLATIEKALAMNKATGGNKTIVILNGRYHEHGLTVDTPVNITSQGAVIDGDGNTVFTIIADSELHNLTVINSSEAIKHDSGALGIHDSSFINNTKAVVSNGELEVYNSKFTQNKNIVIDSASKLIVDNCEFSENTGANTIKVTGTLNPNLGANANPNLGANALGTESLTGDENLIIINSKFIKNSASEGVLNIAGSNALISANEFSRNGAAIAIRNSEANISGNSLNGDSISSIGSIIDIANNNNTLINVENSKLSNLVIEFLENTTVITDNGTIRLNASVHDDMGNAINGGKVTFTSNGQTIGNASVENGIAKLSSPFVKGNYTISGSFDCAKEATVNTGLLRVDVDYYWFIGNDKYETLAEAIDAAELGDVIKGLPGTYTINHQLIGHRYFDAEPWEIIKSVTITSLNETPVTLVGTNKQMFFIDIGSELSLNNIIIRDAGSFSEDGGAIESLYNTNLTIVNCTFINNTGGDGGAVYVGGNLFLKDTVFDSNNGLLAGAVELAKLYYTNEKVIIENVNFTNNNAKYAGALYIGGNDVEMNNVNFINNTATVGGAIQMLSGSCKINNSEFINNKAIANDSVSAQSYGGAIHIYLSDLTIENSNFINNSADGLGGALELENGLYGDITWTIIKNSNFTGNIAKEGGAIYLGTTYDPYVDITNTIFDSNIANSTGGAIYDNGGHVTIRESEFNNNMAIDGYDIIHVFGDLFEGEPYYGEMTIIDSEFSNNDADYTIFVNAYGILTVESCDFNGENTVLFNRGDSELTKVESQSIGNYSIENYGTLSLSENIFDKPILNNNKILTETYIVVLNNETKTGIFNEIYTLKAQFTDDNGNIIERIDLNFVVDGEEIEASYDNSSHSFTADILVLSTEQLIEAKTNATGYDDLKVKTGVLIAKENANMTVTIVKAIGGEDAIINVSLIPDAEGTVSIKILDTNETYTANITDGSATITIPGLDVGTYDIEISYSGDDKYAEDVQNINLTVAQKENYAIDINVITEGQSANISISLPEDINGTVKVKIDSKEINVAVKNGKANIVMDNLSVGTHNISVIFEGNDKYAEKEENSTFTIAKINSFVSITVKNITYGEDAVIELVVPSDATGDVLVNIDGKNYYAHINGGKASITVSNLENGTYIVSAEYYGDSQYLNSTNKTNFTVTGTQEPPVPQEETGFSLIHIISIDENGLITGILKDQTNSPIANAEIVYTINGDEKAIATDSDGIFKVQGAIESETFIEYKGTDLINGTNTSVKIGSIYKSREATKILYSDMNTTAINPNIDGRKGKYFEFYLVDEKGNPMANKRISVGFNGVIYNRTTDENGKARLQINLVMEGIYTFAICFLGDDDYNGSFAVAKITVSKQTPKLTTASKTYKASAKTKTLTATFKTSLGNAVKGKKITFTVNGKTYTATTNAKGVATVKVSLTKKGSYSFTAKFAGDNTYKAISKKATLKIN